MERASGSAIPPGHVCLLNGSSRGRRLAVAGAVMLLLPAGLATAVSLAGGDAQPLVLVCLFLVLPGLILFAVGLQDVLGRRAFRRLAAESRLPPWNPVRGAPRSGEIRVTALRPANPAWRWMVRLVLVTSLAAYLLFPLTLIGGGGRAVMWLGVSILTCVLLLVGMEVFRGKARGRIEFPVPCLLVGETADVLFQIDRCGAELPPESVEFTLRCVQAGSALGGLLRTAFVAETVPPIAIRFVPGEYDGWELSFRLPHDLHRP